MDDLRFDALARSIGRFVSRRQVWQASGGVAALGLIRVQTQDASAYCASCSALCRRKKKKKKKSCFKKCAAPRQPKVCSAEAATCGDYEICTERGYDRRVQVACGGGNPSRTLCKCSRPGCNCTPVSGGYLSGSACSGVCIPLTCDVLNPEASADAISTWIAARWSSATEVASLAHATLTGSVNLKASKL